MIAPSLARPTIFGALALALFAPLEARAGGFYISDIGTRGMARAGAFVAAPDSLVALHYNPAGLSRLRGLHAEASLSIVGMSLDYQRKCPCLLPSNPEGFLLDPALEASFAPVSSNTPLAIPFLGVAYGLPMWDLTVALGAYGPNSGRHEWGTLPSASSPAFPLLAARQPQRYSALEVKNLEANYVLGAGAQPLQGLRVGATVMLYQSGSDQTANLWVNSKTFAQIPEDPNFDVPLDVEFTSKLQLSWSVGASYEPLPGLTVGASFRPGRHISSEGKIGVSLPALLSNFGASIVGDQIGITLDTAPIVRVGVEYAVPNVFEVEAAVVGELWSNHKEIVVSPKNISFTLGDTTQGLGDIVLPRNWRDTYSIRVGGELNLFQPLVGVQAGYFFEPSAIPAERVDTSRVDLDKHGFALGLSTQLYGVRLDVSAMYVLLSELRVRDSVIEIKAPLASASPSDLGSRDYVTIVGNGDYSGNYLIGSAALSFELDAL